MIRTHRDLEVWQRAMDLVVEVYKIAASLPAIETYGLAAQMRRAACSIPSNIAEGHGRRYRTEYLRFTRISYGSCQEVDTQIEIARRLAYVDDQAIASASALIGRVRQMLSALATSLCRSRTPDPGPRTPN